MGRNGFQYILCYGSTSSLAISKKSEKEFQYILCYGSTHSATFLKQSKEYFNTSYVTVQL